MNPTAYEALRNHAAYLDHAGRGNMRVTGEDRVRLLHAMCTNHIEQLQTGTGCYAFFLTAQGRILSDAHIYCMPDYLLLDTEPEVKDRLREHLERYIIADDATVVDFSADMAAITVEGPAAESLLRSVGAPTAHMPSTFAEWGHTFVAHSTYTGTPGYCLICPTEGKADLLHMLTSAGIAQAGLEEADAVRLENGKPRYGVDFSEANIPHETQLMDAISFQKGCYLGQEIVERVRSRGHVNRQLTSIEIESQTAPRQGTKIQIDNKDVGEITSAAFSPAAGKVVALGYVRAEALNSPLSVDGASARVRPARS